MPDFPRPVLKKNDRLAGWLIIIFSIIVFAGVTALGRMPKPEREFSFDIHLLPMANAIINSCVALLLVDEAPDVGKLVPVLVVLVVALHPA